MMNRGVIKYAIVQPLLAFSILSVVFTTMGCEEKPPIPPPAPEVAEATATGQTVELADDMTAKDLVTAESDSVLDATRLPVVAVNDIKTIITETAERDQILVIDFWATWCVPCVQMFPSLHEGLIARGDAVRAVTVTLDDPSREPAAIEFLTEQDALHDAHIFMSDSAEQQALADQIGETWDSLAVPAILVYDTGGQLVGEFLEGGSTDAILRQVDRLLASQEKPAS